MNKICTSIEQSKKLIKLGIDVNTADMYWKNGVSDRYIQCFTPFVCGDYQNGINFDYDIPAWSLTALLGLMPKLYDEDDLNDGGCQPVLCKGFDNNMWHIVYRSTMYGTDWYCDPIDAAFDMVCWLLENKKIQ